MIIEQLTADRFETRDTQEECLTAIADARDRGVRAASVNAATAFGKTYVAARDFQTVLEEKPDARALYLSHQNDILRQARETFEEVLGPGVSHGSVFGGELEDQTQVVYASFQTMNAPLGESRVYEALDPGEFDYVIDDESHHAPAHTYRRVLEYFDGFMLGLTAVPDRRDGEDILDIFEEEVYRKSLEEAMAEGLVTPVRYKTYTDHIRAMGALPKPVDKIKLTELNNTLFLPRRDEEIAEIIFDELAQIDDPHAMIFCQSIEHANRMAQLIPDAQAIHSRQSPEDQAEYKQAFKAGEISVACVVDKFNEGIDLPDVNLVAFLRSTSSQRIWLQQLGRGLRRIPGKEMVTVVDLAADIERINMVLELQRRIAKIQAGEPVVEEATPPVEFAFEEEAQDAIALIGQVRQRIAERKAELELRRERFRPLAPEGIEALTLEVPASKPPWYAKDTDSQEMKSLELSSQQVLALRRLFTHPTGVVDEHRLKDDQKGQFGKVMKLQDVREMLMGMYEDRLIVPCVYGAGPAGSAARWRLTAETVQALAEVEPYRTMYEQSFQQLQDCITDLFNKAKAEGASLSRGRLRLEISDESGHRSSLSLLTDPYRQHKVIKDPATMRPMEIQQGNISLTASDITQEELGGPGERASFREKDGYSSRRDERLMPYQVQLTKTITLHEDHVASAWQIHADVYAPGNPNHKRVTRRYAAGELDGLTEQLKSYEVDKINSW